MKGFVTTILSMFKRRVISFETSPADLRMLATKMEKMARHTKSSMVGFEVDLKEAKVIFKWTITRV